MYGIFVHIFEEYIRLFIISYLMPISKNYDIYRAYIFFFYFYAVDYFENSITISILHKVYLKYVDYYEVLWSSFVIIWYIG